MSNSANTTENVTIHLKVKDFNSWRTSYNGHEKERASAGITNGECSKFQRSEPRGGPSGRR